MASSEGRTSGRLIVYEAFAAPHQPLELIADLVQAGFLTQAPLGGEVLLFRHQGRRIGRAMTGGDGRAITSLIPRLTGETTITVRLVENPRVMAAEAAAKLFVWERRQPIVLVMLTALIRAKGGLFPFLGSGQELADPEPEALQALAQAARRLSIIYLSGANRVKLPGLQQWRDRHRLPAGPVILLAAGAAGMATQIEQWRREGWRIPGGLVSTPEEANALLAKGLVVVAPPASREKWPEKTIKPSDWADVTKQLSALAGR